ncbi:hypothetical protein HSRCO_0073 [Halanaeroarchaeum sp. HSR-CO]|uniref:hypothetical protein n=1 Tax=Halanaeroarchaeum sp. HSR-CO TaxID=2866382 RepID=UPI00217D78D3|nr:hypothetical protein [Halanaeroarchaeum sp. HSR-CO]UWG46375.1 hypothetical protein HSRCO_0073 [Halanaeroarchaeum sp. HSR-CO]
MDSPKQRTHENDSSGSARRDKTATVPDRRWLVAAVDAVSQDEQFDGYTRGFESTIRVAFGAREHAVTVDEEAITTGHDDPTFVVGFIDALDRDRPAVLGCSVGAIVLEPGTSQLSNPHRCTVSRTDTGRHRGG